MYLFGSGISRLSGPAGAFGRTYVISPTLLTSGTFSIRAYDRVYNSGSTAFTVYYDDEPPEVILNVQQTFTHFDLSWQVTERSGLGAFALQVCDAQGNCETLQDMPEEAGQRTYDGAPEQTYTFTLRVVDKTGHAAERSRGPLSTAVETRYYLFGGQRIAMCKGGEVFHLHGDHPGSIGLVTDAAGNIVSQVRYRPYGALRWTSGTSPTDFGFTAQRLDDFGLMDYNARYYAPRLGRFVSADSIVPGAGSPLAWDRYAYVDGNPLRYTDPSGH